MDFAGDNDVEIQPSFTDKDEEEHTDSSRISSEHENPYAESYLPAIATYPTMRDMVASYVYSRSVSVVRKHAKSVGAKQNKMNRAQLRGHLFSAAAAKVKAGQAQWDTVLGDDFEKFVTDPVNQTRAWHLSPSDFALEVYRPAETGDRRRPAAGQSSFDDIPTSGPSMNLSEFGQLVCVLLQNDDVRRDLIGSGLDLSRAQSDRHEGRDDFWSNSVSSAFNDPTIRVALSMSGHLSDVDVNAPPRAIREGEKLKSIFFKSRGVFTKVYQKWSLSGQNDPERFESFLPRGPRSSEISAEGKRALILFIAMKCGTPDEDVDALDFTKKLAPDGIGFDDLDRGSSQEDGTSERPAKRSRYSASTALTQSLRGDEIERFGAMLTDVMKPVIEMAQSAPTSAATIVSVDIDTLLQKYEAVAEKLQAVYDRESVNDVRFSDRYLRVQLEKRLNIIQHDIERYNSSTQ
jgi:hypothetical protein